MRATRRVTPRCILLAAVGLAFLVSPAVAVDLLLRSTGQLDFSDEPIPADFFGPGSLPFEGVVLLTGVPFGPFGADTIMSVGPLVGGVETVPIEIIAMQLQSVAPIEVMFDSGPSSFVDVFVELSTSGPPSTGTLDLQQTSPSGGQIVKGQRFSNTDLKFGTLPKFELMDNMDLSSPPQFLYIPPPDYPGAPGFYPLLPMHWVPEQGPLSISMIPVPEPASIVLTGSGLVIALLLARRVRRR